MVNIRELNEASEYSYLNVDANIFKTQFKEEIKKHPQTYEALRQNGWQPVDVHAHKSSGYHGILLSKNIGNGNTAYILASRGTEPVLGVRQLRDLRSDFDLYMQKVPEQFKHADHFYQTKLAPILKSGDQVYLTGHSLGSAPSQMLSAKYGHKAVVFEDPGVKSILDNHFSGYDPNKISIYNARPNFVNTMGEHVVKPTVIPNINNQIKGASEAGYVRWGFNEHKNEGMLHSINVDGTIKNNVHGQYNSWPSGFYSGYRDYLNYNNQPEAWEAYMRQSWQKKYDTNHPVGSIYHNEHVMVGEASRFREVYPTYESYRQHVLMADDAYKKYSLNEKLYNIPNSFRPMQANSFEYNAQSQTKFTATPEEKHKVFETLGIKLEPPRSCFSAGDGSCYAHGNKPFETSWERAAKIHTMHEFSYQMRNPMANSYNVFGGYNNDPLGSFDFRWNAFGGKYGYSSFASALRWTNPFMPSSNQNSPFAYLHDSWRAEVLGFNLKSLSVAPDLSFISKGQYKYTDTFKYDDNNDFLREYKAYQRAFDDRFGYPKDKFGYKYKSSYVPSYTVISEGLRQLVASDNVHTLCDRIASALRDSNKYREMALDVFEFARVLRDSAGFISKLVQTKLINSYNKYHGEGGVARILRDFFGEVGGVEVHAGILKGLINTAEQVFDEDTLIAFKNPDAKMPFTAKEMQEIAWALFNGIYKHNTYPFFSLHFNEKGILYPVIHPAYQNTIIGEVIGYLDYYMKGYLNGGIYHQTVLEKWHVGQNTDKEHLKSLLVDVKKLAKAEDIAYKSLRELSYRYGLETAQEDKQNAFHTGNHKYMTSFRIISYLEDVQKEGNVFVVDPSFKVEYTIDLNPDYKEHLEKYRQQHGSYPEDYLKLNALYRRVAEDIKNQMPKFSFAKELFAKLGVINFLSYYYTTLKEMGKVPKLDKPDTVFKSSFPEALPPIPVRYYQPYKIKLTIKDIFSRLEQIEAQEQPANQFNVFLHNYYKDNYLECPQKIKDNIVKIIGDIILAQIQTEKKPVLEQEYLQELTEEILQIVMPIIFTLDRPGLFKNIFDGIISNIEEVPKEIQQLVSEEEFTQLETFDERASYLEEITQAVYEKIMSYFAGTHQQQMTELEGKLNTQINDLQRTGQVPHDLNAQLNDIKGKLRASQASQVNSVEKFKQMVLDAISSTKNIKQNLLKEIIKSFSSDKSILDSYLHSTLDIADGAYMQEIGTDLRIIGGVGLTLAEKESSPLAKPFAFSLHKVGHKLKAQNFTVIEEGKKYYSLLKLETYDKPVSSNLEYVLDKTNDNIQDSTGASGDAKRADSYVNLTTHELAFADDVDALKIELDKNPSIINSKNGNGYTPLLVAAEAGNIKSAKLLLSYGANNNFMLSSGLTALTLAIINGHSDVAMLLLASPNINIDTVDDRKMTPLHMAIAFRLPDVAKALIGKGAGLGQARLEDGYYALHLAAKQGLADVVVAILKANRFDINTVIASGKTALHVASGFNHHAVVNLLIKHGASVSVRDGEGNTALSESLSKGHYELAHKLALITPINVVNNHNQTASLFAAQQNRFDVADVLVTRGESIATLDNQKHNYIYYLLFWGQYHRYKNLVEQGKIKAEQEFEEGSSLYIAAKAGHNLLVDYLHSLGVQFKANNSQEELFSLAIKSDNISYLRQNYKEETWYNKILESVDNKKLLFLAAKSGSYRCFIELLDKLNKDEINKLKAGEHILAAVLQAGKLNILQAALKRIDDINIPIDLEGNYPVHYAVKVGFIKALKLLKERGADFSVKNKDGYTVYQLAIINDDDSMLGALLEMVNRRDWPSGLYGLAEAKHKKECLSLLVSKKYLAKEYTSEFSVSDLNNACERGQLSKVVEILSEHNKFDLKVALHSAIKNGYTDIAKLLLQAGADPKSKIWGVDIYAAAVKAGHIKSVIFLNELGYKKALGKSELYYRKLTDNQYVQSAIMGLNDFLEGMGSKLLSALHKNNYAEIKRILIDYPVNSLLIKSSTGEKPFLHYLFGNEATNSNLILEQVLAYHYKLFSPFVKDAAGNGLLVALLNSAEEDISERIDILAKYFAGDIAQLIKERDSLGTSILDIIVSSKNKLFELMLEKELLKSDDIDTYFLLHKTIELGDKLAVLKVLKSGAAVNIKNALGITPLMTAAAHGLLDISKLLVTAGAEVEAISIRHSKALHIAMANEHEDVALYLAGLTQDLTQQNRDGYDVIILAARHDMVSLLDYYQRANKILIQYDEQGKNALHHASLMGKKNAVLKLLEMGFTVNSVTLKKEENQLHNVTPLQLALFRGHQEVAALLLRQGASLTDKDSNGNNAFDYAAQCPEASMLYFLRTFTSFYTEATQQRLLFSAVSVDNVALLRELYLMGAPLDLLNANGLNLLQKASLAGSHQCAHFLLEQGFSVNLISSHGDTALHMAAMKGSVNIIRQLIKYGATVNVQNTEKKTALFLACEYGNYAALLELLKAGANLTIADSQGMTPAQVALSKGFTEIAELLFALGDTSLLHEAYNKLPQYMKSALQMYSPLLLKFEEVTKKLVGAVVSQKSVAMILQNKDALRLLLDIEVGEELSDYEKEVHISKARHLAVNLSNNHPDWYNDASIVRAASFEEMVDILLHYEPSKLLPESTKMLAMIPRKLSDNEVEWSYVIAINDMLKDDANMELILAMANMLKRISISAGEQFLKGLSLIDPVKQKDFAQLWLDTLTKISTNKAFLNKIDNAFLSLYSWDTLAKIDLPFLIIGLESETNENIKKWFFEYFSEPSAKLCK